MKGAEAPGTPAADAAPDAPRPTMPPDFVPPVSALEFTDAAPAAYYAEPVARAVEKGVTSGAGNGKFSPDNACDRGTIMTFLYRAFAR